jgi:hypothetical protein
MKLSEILKDLKKLNEKIKASKPILIRLDDETQSYQDWLKQHGVNDEDVIVVNIWIPST